MLAAMRPLSLKARDPPRAVIPVVRERRNACGACSAAVMGTAMAFWTGKEINLGSPGGSHFSVFLTCLKLYNLNDTQSDNGHVLFSFLKALLHNIPYILNNLSQTNWLKLKAIIVFYTQK